MLLADEQDPHPATPPVVDSEAEVVAHREGAKADEVHELGMSLGELVGLLVRRGPVAVRSRRVALLRAPCDLLLALPVATGVVDVERPLTRRAIQTKIELNM